MPDMVALKGAIDAYSERALGAYTSGDELSRQRSLALDAYQDKIIDQAPEGRSEVQDRSVFETVQWILPSLIRIFAGGDNVVEFDPTGPEDEDVAKQESKILNYLVTCKTDWFLTCMEWFQDALVTKNAYCMAYMDESLQPEVDRYEGQSQEQLAMLLQDDVEIVGAEERIDEDNPEPVVDPMTGQPMVDPFTGQPMMQPRVIYDVEVRRTKAKSTLRLQVLPPERVLVGEDTPSFQIDDDCNYFEYYELLTISDLRKQGFDVPDNIGSDDMADTLEDLSRDELMNTRDDDIDTGDPSMRQVKVRTIWIRHDYDEDGIAELQKVIRVGEDIISHDPATRIPVACIVPFLNTHRHIGMSVADLVFDIQRIKTAMLRSGLDSLYLATNPRHAVSQKVNIDDMLTSRPGALVRMKDGAVPGEGHVMPLQTENTFPYAQQGLQHMDMVIESRVGVNRMFQGIDESAMSSTNAHNAIGQLSTMASQRVEQIARIFGNGMEKLFSICHELVIKSGHSMEAIKLNGEWIDVDPNQWRTGRDMKVVAPYAAGNKDSLLQRLMMISQIHEKALMGGLPIVDAVDAYELALEIASAADVPGERFFTDPRTVPPKEPPPDHTMIALEIEASKVQQSEADSERDAQVDIAKAASDAEVKREIARLNSETQIALAQLKAGQAVDIERFRASVKSEPIEKQNKAIADNSRAIAEIQRVAEESIKKVENAVDELRDQQKAPIKIVRKNGKIVGKEVGGEFVPLEDG